MANGKLFYARHLSTKEYGMDSMALLLLPFLTYKIEFSLSLLEALIL